MSQSLELRDVDRAWDRASMVTTTAVVSFTDTNGTHESTVGVDGEFWRVVMVRAYSAGLPPKAARKLAREILKAADRAEEEDRTRERLRKEYQRLERAGAPG